MLRIFTFLILSVFIISCVGESKKDAVITKGNDTPTIASNKLNVPGLPQGVMEQLFKEATYVDYIFYNLPFSLSQDNQASIHANLKLISAEPLKSLPVNCKPIGREFFHIGGEIPYEADLYYSDGCYGYVFIKDNKPLYANKLSTEGMKFYTNIVNQASQIRNQAINER